MMDTGKTFSCSAQIGQTRLLNGGRMLPDTTLSCCRRHHFGFADNRSKLAAPKAFTGK